MFFMAHRVYLLLALHTDITAKEHKQLLLRLSF